MAALSGRTFKRLHLYGRPTKLSHLSTLDQLVELRMERTKLEDFSLLAGMKRLEELIYSSGSLNECDLSFAARSLTSLHLSSHRSLTDLTPIGSCTELRRMTLRNLPHLESCCDLKSLPHLEFLVLQNLRQWPSLTGLAQAQSLRRLHLDRTKIVDRNWEPLLKLKRLEYVSALEDAFGKADAAEFRKRRPGVQTPRRFPG